MEKNPFEKHPFAHWERIDRVIVAWDEADCGWLGAWNETIESLSSSEFLSRVAAAVRRFAHEAGLVHVSVSANMELMDGNTDPCSEAVAVFTAPPDWDSPSFFRRLREMPWLYPEKVHVFLKRDDDGHKYSVFTLDEDKDDWTEVNLNLSIAL